MYSFNLTDYIESWNANVEAQILAVMMDAQKHRCWVLHLWSSQGDLSCREDEFTTIFLSFYLNIFQHWSFFSLRASRKILMTWACLTERPLVAEKRTPLYSCCSDEVWPAEGAADRPAELDHAEAKMRVDERAVILTLDTLRVCVRDSV